MMHSQIGRHPVSDCPVGIVPIHWPVGPDGVDHQLAEIRRLGFTGVQLGESLPQGDELSDLLARHELRVAEVYAALPCTSEGPTAEAYDIARKRLDLLERSGGDVLVPAIDGSPERDIHTAHADRPGAPRLSDTGWSKLGELVNRLADETRDRGHRLAFHPHAGTYVETTAETEQFLEVTAASPAGVCVDTGHVLVGGGDPRTILEIVGDRLTHIHLKDVDSTVLDDLRSGAVATLTEAVTRRIFCPLGGGVLDLAGVLSSLEALGYSGWLMVEQDTSWEPPVEASAISRRVLSYAIRALDSGS